MFFRKKNKPVKTFSEVLTAEKCADMLLNTLSGYMAKAKPVFDTVMKGKDENKKSCLTECYLATVSFRGVCAPIPVGFCTEHWR